jgi:hypothetical protein
MDVDTRDRARLYARIDESSEPELVYEDRLMTPEHAAGVNEKLAADGEPYRWRAYGSREGDSVAA